MGWSFVVSFFALRMMCMWAVGRRSFRSEVTRADRVDVGETAVRERVRVALDRDD
jgi:hypothetical protein